MLDLERLNLRNPWLDVCAIALWGLVLLKLWLGGQLHLLIHPAYHWLTIFAGIALSAIALVKAAELLQKTSRQNSRTRSPQAEHLSFFPPGLGSCILIFTAVLGLIIEPTVFVSATALQRGVNDFLPITQSQPQSFGQVTRPEDKTIIDWVRTLNVYPEPDAYSGQKVNVEGFVVHSPVLPDNYFTITRFVMTCCAADVYPVGLPVKLETSRDRYPQDTWLAVQGEMITEEFSGKRQLTIQPSSIEEIPVPANPYHY